MEFTRGQRVMAPVAKSDDSHGSVYLRHRPGAPLVDAIVSTGRVAKWSAKNPSIALTLPGDSGNWCYCPVSEIVPVDSKQIGARGERVRKAMLGATGPASIYAEFMAGDDAYAITGDKHSFSVRIAYARGGEAEMHNLAWSMLTKAIRIGQTIGVLDADMDD